MCKKGNVFNVQRFSTVDGPGIRTVIFLKGCPLRCAWCHNPESQSMESELFYKPELCIGCGNCERICPVGAHRICEAGHLFNRERCIACGKCAEECFLNALEICGGEKTVEEIMATVVRDMAFYEESGGGVTVSGGEPLMQLDFTYEILRRAKEQGIHTAVETSGYTARDISVLHPVTDLWLYDIKLLEEEKHIRYTGVSGCRILENLRRLDDLGAKIVLRCPIVPDVNMDEGHFLALAQLANSLHNVVAVHLEPYHPLGLSKAGQLGKKQAYTNEEFLDGAAIVPYGDILRQKIDAEVVII